MDAFCEETTEAAALRANADVLNMRAFAYNWFQSVFGNQPTADSLAWLTDESTLSALEIFFQDVPRQAEPDNPAACAHTLGCAASQSHFPDQAVADAFSYFGNLDSEESSVEELADSYTRLFLGPGIVPLKHWESVYVRGDNALFQPSTLEVRRAYVECGYLHRGYPHVADDHIGIELDFMAALAGDIASCQESGNLKEAGRLVRASSGFLDLHLLRWAPAYEAAASHLEKRYDFWKHASTLLKSFLSTDRVLLGDLEEILR